MMRGRGLFFAFTAAVTLVLVALGAWQWQRRAEKAAFVASIAAAAREPAKPLAAAEVWDRVTLSGRFRSDPIAYVRTSRPAPKPGERDSRGLVPVGGFGVWVMQAFEAQDACANPPCPPMIVLVNRGFLPTPPNGAIPAFETPHGAVTLTGFLRPREREGLFPPGNDPAKGRFFFRDTTQIARFLQLEDAASDSRYARFIDRQAPPDEVAPPFGMDVADLLRSIPNNHLEYALTWWSLAATNLVISALFLASARRKRRDDGASIG